MRYGNAHYSGSNAVKVNITIRLATDRRSFAKFSPTVENYSLRMCAFFLSDVSIAPSDAKYGLQRLAVSSFFDQLPV